MSPPFMITPRIGGRSEPFWFIISPRLAKGIANVNAFTFATSDSRYIHNYCTAFS